MKPIPSTAEILFARMQNQYPDKRWVDWAYNMLVAGFDTENLVMLAGETEPFNYFEVQRLADKIFKELELSCDDRKLVLINYASFLINRSIEGEMSPVKVLSTLKDVYEAHDGLTLYQDFRMLYYAYNELKFYDEEDQYYWSTATSENINEIILDYFKTWINTYKKA